MFERFAGQARDAVIAAQEHARRMGHSEIGAEDILVGTVTDPQSIPARVLRGVGLTDPLAALADPSSLDAADAEALRSLGIELDAIRARADRTFGPGALDRPRRQRSGLFGRRAAGGHLPLSAEAKESLELALRTAVGEGYHAIGAEHLFLGLLATEQGSSARLLDRLGVTEDQTGLRRRVLAELDRAA
ncbi:MAG: Clp protease N-terminal domain-containing protein [Propionibacteriaceae bacterium]